MANTVDITKQTQAVARWASDDPTRENLACVRFEDGLQMATNGHGLAGLIPAERQDPAEYGLINGTSAAMISEPVSLPVAAVQAAIKTIPKRISSATAWMGHVLEGGERNGHVTLMYPGAQSVGVCDPAPDNFPDISQIVPADDVMKTHVGIRVEYLAKVAQSMKDVGAENVMLELPANEKPRCNCENVGTDPPCCTDDCASKERGAVVSPMRFTGRNKDGGDQLVIILMPVRM